MHPRQRRGAAGFDSRAKTERTWFSALSLVLSLHTPRSWLLVNSCRGSDWAGKRELDAQPRHRPVPTQSGDG